MPVFIISSVDEQSRRELAEALAAKLGCECLSREQMTDKATEAGIAVGRLEVAVLKKSQPRERLARDKGRYMAFITAAVCERASKGDVVYHGRTCHRLLQGISHVIRVCVVPDHETRLHNVMRRLGLDWDKAAEYIRQLDEDINNWAHFLHGADLADSAYFDMMFNLQNISIQSASSFLCSLYTLPDFQPTPASLRAMRNLWLEARAVDLLGRDPRTAGADLKVSTQEGRVTVSYMPGQAGVAEEIPRVLEGLEGTAEVVTTMATTNLLWLAESFDSESTLFTEIADLAGRWGAAVELLRFVGSPEGDNGEATGLINGTPGSSDQWKAPVPKAMDPTGGVEDDVEDAHGSEEGGLAFASERLIELNCFAGSNTVIGHTQRLLAVLKSDPMSERRFSLVVIGDMFQSKGHAIQLRMRREVAGLIRERVKIPVITADEMQERVLFGKSQFMRLGLYLAVTVLLFGAVLTHQEQVMNFLAGQDWSSYRVLATLGVAVFIPVVAYFWGSAAGLILKLLKFQ